MAAKSKATFWNSFCSSVRPADARKAGRDEDACQLGGSKQCHLFCSPNCPGLSLSSHEPGGSAAETVSLFLGADRGLGEGAFSGQNKRGVPARSLPPTGQGPGLQAGTAQPAPPQPFTEPLYPFFARRPAAKALRPRRGYGEGAFPGGGAPARPGPPRPPLAQEPGRLPAGGDGGPPVTDPPLASVPDRLPPSLPQAAAAGRGAAGGGPRGRFGPGFPPTAPRPPPSLTVDAGGDPAPARRRAPQPGRQAGGCSPSHGGAGRQPSSAVAARRRGRLGAVVRPRAPPAGAVAAGKEASPQAGPYFFFCITVTRFRRREGAARLGPGGSILVPSPRRGGLLRPEPVRGSRGGWEGGGEAWRRRWKS